MKKVLSIFLVSSMLVMTLVGLSGFSSGKMTSKSNSESSNVVTKAINEASKITNAKIGFLAPTLQNDFFISIDDGLKKECAKRGWKYTSASFNNDSSTAVSDIENMVTGKCNVIIAMVSDASCDDALKQAQKAGVKIMECGVQTKVYDVCLNVDQYKVGLSIGDMAAKWINKQLDGKGNVVVYTTYQNVDMKNRGQGIQDALKKLSPKSKILQVVDIGKDVVGSGTSTTENMLQKYPNVNVICSYGDAAAVESAQAVKAAGKGNDKFGVFSCDGTTESLKAIANNDVNRGTIVFAPIAPQMINYASQLLSGKKFGSVVIMGSMEVTKTNVSKYYTAK